MEADAELTDKRQRFIDEYLLDCNATQAAIRAGYALSGARQEGSRLLSNADIRAEINKRLAEAGMPAEEVIKQFVDIAKTRLNDYLQVVVRERGTKIPQPLAEAIAELDEKILFEEEFTVRSIHVLQLSAKEAAKYQAGRRQHVDAMRLSKLRYEIELSKNPDATRLIDGPPETYEAVELDMVALANAQDLGRIKTLSYTEFGPKVEMYAADGALRDLGRVLGIFEKDNRQTAGTDVEIIIGGSPETPDA
ncbi:terminase small subunit [Hymenobacter properus]|uniref:Terminase small subunit n=1 Tax=Hymenobacter properus TaxID=2791026 RepID=A0A931BJW9_9BACT|nr:terminase small subunit [Hymenobacter properus]MBF9140830.1 terminase small subunit [Hymenobacter properus]MBR7719639.1 terminase small subunit [Microvirga sp. SRT04]